MLSFDLRQDEPPYQLRSNVDSCERSYDNNSGPMGCHVPNLHDAREEKEAPKKKKKKKKKNKTKKEGEILACAIPISTSRADCLLDNDIGTCNQKQKTSNSDQCIMEIGPEKDQCSVRSISCSIHAIQEERTCRNTTDERLLLPIPEKPERRSGSITGTSLGLRELRRGKPMDLIIPMEVQIKFRTIDVWTKSVKNLCQNCQFCLNW